MATIQGALDLVKKAVSLDNSGKQQEAISVYALAIEHLRQIFDRGGVDAQTRELLSQKIQEYTKRVDYLKSSLNLHAPTMTSSPLSATSPTSSSSVDSFPSLPPLQSSSSFSSPPSRMSKDQLIQNALNHANMGVKCESENRIADAVDNYQKSSEYLHEASLLEQSIENRLQFLQKKQEYQSRAEQLKSSPFYISQTSSSSSNTFSSDVPFPQVDDIDMSAYNNIELSSNASEFIDMAINYTSEAIKEDDIHNFGKAIQLYLLSIQYFQAALQYETNDKIRTLIGEKLTNNRIRSEFLKNKINYQGQASDVQAIPFALKPGGKYKDPVRKKTVMEKLVKTIKGPKNISDHWL
ncbi:hypothetical protein DFA_11560 [Cavenderia fasciculata]|uniref:MIT domain-containing protein n=1 Tax=Cavenderia fasciculata TaxID=261658 RepID=F4QDK2_CACFS|nr:uncharacterized protein DFA_11560 [Cavenderia fasciculata]EGG13799.1 hypothetical protein DFA_11560 [Cavenderia fasciculata]|eukprot:XP_004350507.1 hypothetical protein DFA_11560 [Cavenderia fasciculata]